MNSDTDNLLSLVLLGTGRVEGAKHLEWKGEGVDPHPHQAGLNLPSESDYRQSMYSLVGDIDSQLTVVHTEEIAPLSHTP